jgi:DNA-binding transcriptional regulator YdaS (Cro superfamily)
MVDPLTPFEALNLAIERLGTQAKLAELCNVSTTAAWKWVQSAKRLPAEHVLGVEAATGVSRHALRPDIYPRGLVDGIPFEPEEPTLDVYTPLVFSRQASRDSRASDADARFHGVDRRAGAQA